MSLSNEQLTALEASITHWNCVCYGLEPSAAAEGCPCCQIYGDWACGGCPVKAVYGYQCRDTDFYLYAKNHNTWLTIPGNKLVACSRRSWFKGIEYAESVLNQLLAILPPEHPWRAYYYVETE